MSTVAVITSTQQPKASYSHVLRPVVRFLTTVKSQIPDFGLTSKSTIVPWLNWEDYVIIPVLLMALISSIASSLSENQRIGRHLSNVRPTEIGVAQEHDHATQLMFSLSIGLTKISILTFYFRFCTSAIFRMAIYATLAFVLAWTVAFSGLVTFQCLPVYSFWVRNASTQCVPSQRMIVHGVLNFFSNVFIFVLPLPLVMNLNLPRRQKTALLGMFLLGILVCVGGLLKIMHDVIYIHNRTRAFDIISTSVKVRRR